jgi:L-ascorbate metabolism protein UlaG (beta-lactamase superfamily)
MIRPLAALAAGLLLSSAVAAADPASSDVTIRWHGQSFFEIISPKGTRIVTDPHAIENYGRVRLEADVITISHLHTDHTQWDVVENARQAKILWGLKIQGKQPEWHALDERVGDVRIRTIATYHDDAKGMERGKNSAFVFDIDGLHVVHLGDLGHVLTKEQVKEFGRVDVLMIPVGGVYTINGEDARKVVAQLKPTRYVLPMHYGTKVFSAVLPPDEFLEGFKKEQVKKLDSNELVVKKDFKPAEPVVVLLGWEKK